MDKDGGTGVLQLWDDSGGWLDEACPDVEEGSIASQALQRKEKKKKVPECNGKQRRPAGRSSLQQGRPRHACSRN